MLANVAVLLRMAIYAQNGSLNAKKGEGGSANSGNAHNKADFLTGWLP